MAFHTRLFSPFAKNPARFQGAKIGLSSGWWRDNDLSLARTLNVQLRIRLAESKVRFIRQPMIAVEDQSRRRSQVGKRYLHMSIISHN